MGAPITTATATARLNGRRTTGPENALHSYFRFGEIMYRRAVCVGVDGRRGRRCAGVCVCVCAGPHNQMRPRRSRPISASTNICVFCLYTCRSCRYGARWWWWWCRARRWKRAACANTAHNNVFSSLGESQTVLNINNKPIHTHADGRRGGHMLREGSPAVDAYWRFWREDALTYRDESCMTGLCCCCCRCYTKWMCV